MKRFIFTTLFVIGIFSSAFATNFSIHTMKGQFPSQFQYEVTFRHGQLGGWALVAPSNLCNYANVRQLSSIGIGAVQTYDFNDPFYYTSQPIALASEGAIDPSNFLFMDMYTLGMPDVANGLVTGDTFTGVFNNYIIDYLSLGTQLNYDKSGLWSCNGSYGRYMAWAFHRSLFKSQGNSFIVYFAINGELWRWGITFDWNFPSLPASTSAYSAQADAFSAQINNRVAPFGWPSNIISNSVQKVTDPDIIELYEIYGLE